MARTPDYFDDLLRWLELERAAGRARFEDEKRALTLAEREARGLMVPDLEVVEDAVGLAGRFLLTFERPERQRIRARLGPGDPVELRPRRDEDAPPTPGIVTRGSWTRLQIAFDRAPPPWMGDGRVRLDIVPNDVTFDRASSAIRRAKALDRGREGDRRAVLLGQKPPRFGKRVTPAWGRPLNPEQQDAAERALAAEDFFLVHGPPGTGKSTVLGEVAYQAAQRGERILATAASNAAVDHLLELCLERGIPAVRVGHPARVMPHLVEHTLDVRVEDHPDRKLAVELFEEAFELFGYARKQRKQGRSRERFANARSSTAEAKKLLDDARALERKAVDAVLGRATVICSTLASLDSGPIAQEHFDLALIDEATQSIEPLAWIAFLRADRVVLAGDHKQLPPTVLSLEAAKAGLARSVFERLLEDHGEDVKRMLAEQHRMHAQIMSFPSAELYGGALRAHPSVAGHTLADVLRDGGAGVDAPPVLFLDTAGKGFDEAQPEGSDSRFNEGEAELVVARAKELLAAGLPPSELAIIAPYSAQVTRVRELLEREDVEIDTVDAFQGREKDAILLTLTRSNPDGALGFLTDLRRMNVAMTRARRHLFVVGDSATLAAEPFYARFIEQVQAWNGYRSAWEWPFAPA